MLLVALNGYEGPTPPPTSTLLPEFRRVVSSALPGSHSATLSNVIATVSDLSATGTVQCVETDTSKFCGGRGSGGFLGSLALLDDPSQIGVVLGPLAPLGEAQRVLEAGGAVVTQPRAVDRGAVTLRTSLFDSDGNLAPRQINDVRLPALEVLQGAVPAQVIIGPAALQKGSPLAGLLRATDAIVVVDPAVVDVADAPTPEDRIRIAMFRTGLDAGVIPASSSDGDIGPIVATVGAVVTALLALLAGLMVTGLALADGRADMQTLASVGGPPRLRRRIAASSAAYVTVLGCITGALSGLVTARVLVPLFVRSTGGLFRVPWPMIAFVVLAVPVLTAAVAFVTTRSTVELTRRTGD